MENIILNGHAIFSRIPVNIRTTAQEFFVHWLMMRTSDQVTGNLLWAKDALWKIPIPQNVWISMFQLGWREQSWNHGFLWTNWRSSGSRDIDTVLYGLTDLTRSFFQDYYSIAHVDDHLLITHTYPQSGGTRWVASHSDTIVIKSADIPHSWDLSPFVSSFPQEHSDIWNITDWQISLNGKTQESFSKNQKKILHAVFAILRGESPHFPTEEMTNEDTLWFLLDVYSFLPLQFRMKFFPTVIWHDGTIKYPIRVPLGF